jgi:hypothetical protein
VKMEGGVLSSTVSKKGERVGRKEKKGEESWEEEKKWRKRKEEGWQDENQ